MNKLTIDDVGLKGKKVLIRVDFNVPLTKDCKVADDRRIQAALPSIRKVIESGGRAILMSHLGRPKGKKKSEFTLAPVAERLQELLEQPVKFAPDCVGPEVEQMAAELKDGEVMLLENVRFYPEEEGKKEGEKMSDDDRAWFIEGIAKLGDVYIDDAFGTAHRKHASMFGVPEKLGGGAAGYLMQKELDYFAKAFDNPTRPVVAILGGVKVSDKILVIDNLMKKVDTLLIGGAMAYTFLKAEGIEVGNSLVEADLIEKAKDILKSAKERGVKLLLPVDHKCSDVLPESGQKVEVTTTDGESIPVGLMGLDIGPKTLEMYSKEIANAKTVVWNGPMGVFENAEFAAGTYGIAKAAAESNAVTVVGGGDSASAAKKSGYADKLDHISTGGGASLELMEGKLLPGVAALTNK